MAAAEAIRPRGADIAAILFYGSGLWGKITDDTVLDFYVLVDRYGDFEPRLFLAAMGHLLPPNVYYLETRHQGRPLRCKIAVMRTDQFRRAAAGKSATSQIWSRFAQPCRLVYARDGGTAEAIVEALADALVVFHRVALRDLSGCVSVEDLWRNGLRWTYGAELRSENTDRAGEIFRSQGETLTRRTALAAPLAGKRAVAHPHDPTLFLVAGPQTGPFMQLARRAALVFGKAATLLRLMKGAATFDGGVDYILWKIERHTGIHVEPTELQRRHPLIAGWPLLWRLYRKGAFR